MTPRPKGKPEKAFHPQLDTPKMEQADALLRSIEVELGDADFFTREDLLHLSVFSEVATITRYTYVREALTILMSRGKILERSRTELCLWGRGSRYRSASWRMGEFRPTIERIIGEILAMPGSTSVMEVVFNWTTDQHLTRNVKRATARAVVREMLKEKKLRQTEYGRFKLALENPQ